jgi:hypothetical protein
MIIEPKRPGPIFPPDYAELIEIRVMKAGSRHPAKAKLAPNFDVVNSQGLKAFRAV